MSKSFIHNVSITWKSLLIGGVVGFALIIIFLAILISYQFSQYRNEGQTFLEKEASQVFIVDPPMGSQTPLGIPVTINAKAIGPQSFLSMELWVDGQMFEVYGDSSGGSTPLSSVFTWIPETPGAHSLVARAINSEAQSIYSTSVVVLATVNDGVYSLLRTQKTAWGGMGRLLQAAVRILRLPRQAQMLPFFQGRPGVDRPANGSQT